MTFGLFKITEIQTYTGNPTREPTKTVTFLSVAGYHPGEMQRILPESVADQLNIGDVVRLKIEKIE